MRAVAALLLIAISVPISAGQPRKKQVKDQGELELYNQAVQVAGNPAGAIQALDAWTRKYPESDYRDDRLYLYMQAYSKSSPPQPGKVIDYGSRLIAKDLHTLFAADGLVILNVLFLLTWNVASLPAPSADQLALGKKAAHDLLDFAANYFVPRNKPAATTDTEWAAARESIEKRTRSALVSMAIAPGNMAMAKSPPECGAAATEYSKALADDPQNASVSYHLGKAVLCQARADAGKAAELYPQAIYHFVRAAAIDPTLGGAADAKQIEEYAARIYAAYHGEPEGLEKLRTLVKASPEPPAGFRIETAAALADRKQTEFVQNNPQLALWMAIREQLAGPNGLQYFEGQLKNTLIAGKEGGRGLKGTVVEGRPSCRPKELLVAIPATSRAEITIRLDSAPAGVAVAGEIEFDAVPRLFSKEPYFMLTMDAERIRITNLKIGPCPAGKE
jgi:hypothetical protein